MNYSENRRERLPALYNDRRLREAPIPNLARDHLINEFVPDFGYDYEDAMMEPLNLVNNDEEEVIIPNEYRNAIVLLDRIVVENQVIEASYEVDALDSNEDNNLTASTENLFVDFRETDPLYEANEDEEPVVKYEIVLQRKDFEEIDDILNDGTLNDSEQIAGGSEGDMQNDIERIESNNPSFDAECKIEINVRMDNATQSGGEDDAAMVNDVSRCNTNDEAIPSSSGDWKVETSLNMKVAFDFESDSNGGTAKRFRRSEPNVDAVVLSSKDLETEVNGDMKYVTQNEAESTFGIVALPYSSGVSTHQANDNGEQIEGENAVEISEDIDQFGTNDDAGASSIVVWTKAGDGDESEDDVLYVEPGANWPGPKTFELVGFVKKENDRFSGDLPFGQKVCIRFAHSTLRHF